MAGRLRADLAFRERQFTAEVILWAVRWYLMFPIGYRELELMLEKRCVAVDHTTVFRWIQAYAPELGKRIRPHLRLSNGSSRVDETYVRARGRCTHLYRAVGGRGRTIDLLLSAKRDAEAAKRFLTAVRSRRPGPRPRSGSQPAMAPRPAPAARRSFALSRRQIPPPAAAM